MITKKEVAVLRAARKWSDARREYLLGGGEKRRIAFSNSELKLSQAVRELQEERNREI